MASGWRDDLIEQYFKRGYKYKEILVCLRLVHNEKLSMRQLKRVLSRRSLTRRKNFTDNATVLHTIEQELQSSASNIGYRSMWQRLIVEHGLIVKKETVRLALKLLDPVGVDHRLRHRLKRRSYNGRGPNFVWHIDGYDKLKPFGFCIHGAIDGFSRTILWLKVGVSNNDPSFIAKYFLDVIKDLGGTARVVRSDCGTENTYVAGIQQFLRRNSNDDLAKEKSFIYGKSVSNQRIEAWWSQLRRGGGDWWREHFKELRDNGHFRDSNVVEVECLRFCYMELIREELNTIARLWNNHVIRPIKNNSASPSGRPELLFFIPELSNTQNFLVSADVSEIALCEQRLANSNYSASCSQEFSSLAQIIMTEENLSYPSTAAEARSLYLTLLNHISNL